ncbi:MAG: hypothetical protein ACFB0E_15915 [Leptolyngbyaceae cyanobacterium]
MSLLTDRTVDRAAIANILELFAAIPPSHRREQAGVGGDRVKAANIRQPQTLLKRLNQSLCVFLKQ